MEASRPLAHLEAISTDQESLVEPEVPAEHPHSPIALRSGELLPDRTNGLTGRVRHYRYEANHLVPDVGRIFLDAAKTGAEMLRKEKSIDFRERGHRAVETLFKRHFRGFTLEQLEFSSPFDGQPAEIGMIQRTTAEPSTRLIGIPGLGGTYLSLATFAKAPELRRYSQTFVNKLGTGEADYPQIESAQYRTDDVWDGECRMVEEVLKHYRDEPKVLMGHSFGGVDLQVGLDRLADTNPKLLRNVEAVILLCTSSRRNMLPMPAWAFDRLSELAERGGNGRSQPGLMGFTKPEVSRGIVHKVIGEIPHDNEVLTASLYASVYDRAIIKQTKALGHVPPSQSLARLDVPIFVIKGSRDRLCPDYQSETARKHGAVEIIFHRGHWVANEEEAGFNEVMAEIMHDPRKFEDRCRRRGGKLAYRPRVATA